MLTFSQASSTEVGIAAEFHVPKEVSILGISMFVLGLGLGPLVVGPLSELYGRSIVYRYSYLCFFLFSFPIAFAPNIGELIILVGIHGPDRRRGVLVVSFRSGS